MAGADFRAFVLETKQQAVELIALNISGEVYQLHCREETSDASFKEKALTTSQIGSHKDTTLIVRRVL
jgi:hypothetical protein